MKTSAASKLRTLCWRNILTLTLMILLVISLGSCSFLSSDSNDDDDSMQETQIALGIQQTALAEKELAATRDAQAGGGAVQPTPDLAATQVAASVQQTMAASSGGATPPQQPAITAPPPQQPPTQAAAPTSQQPAGDLQTMMKSAKILLYEDIVNDPSESRYVQKTLKAMGLNFKDDGSAKGWLKNDLLGGAPGGGPWDLVILAIETRGQVSGEYFEYLNDVLNQGTSVILEAWHLDQISGGTVSMILTKCGIQVYPYFPKTGQSLDVVVWPISGASGHPILSDPNSGMSFTRARTKWIWSGDLGDRMALTGNGDAILLMGTNPSENYKDGVLATCMNGQLTHMGFSSHSFEYQTMYPLWENMITNALRVRLMGGQQ